MRAAWPHGASSPVAQAAAHMSGRQTRQTVAVVRVRRGAGETEAFLFHFQNDGCTAVYTLFWPETSVPAGHAALQFEIGSERSVAQVAGISFIFLLHFFLFHF